MKILIIGDSTNGKKLVANEIYALLDGLGLSVEFDHTMDTSDEEMGQHDQELQLLIENSPKISMTVLDITKPAVYQKYYDVMR